MPSANALIIDAASDTNREELARMVKLYEIPDFVKQANLDFTMNPESIAINSYADPVRQKFACHTAAATWVSGMYFHEKKAEYHPKDRQRIESRLENYVDYWRIRPAYDVLVKQANDLISQELPDSSYAYVWVDDRGGKERYLPLNSSMNIKAAAEWLHRYQDRLPFSDRNVIAKKILEKAGNTGTNLGEQLGEHTEKQAGHGIPDPDEVISMIKQRANLATKATHKEEILKLASAVENHARIALQPTELVKLAETIDIIDSALHIKGKYTDNIQRPEDVIFKVTFTKAASEQAELCTLQTGSVYNKNQLAKLAKDDVESLFGSDFANEVCTGLEIDSEKMAEIAHTLPTPDAELLEHLLSEAGQNPAFGKTASHVGPPQEVLEALAKLYD